MSRLKNLISQKDSIGVRLYLLDRLKRGTISKSEITKSLDMIKASDIGDDVFLPYVSSDIIRNDPATWDKKYLDDLWMESTGTGKFDREFVMHICDVSRKVYRKRNICIVASVIGVVLVITALSLLGVSIQRS